MPIDVLTCEASGATDPDGEAVFWLYTWWRGDEQIDGALELFGELARKHKIID